MSGLEQLDRISIGVGLPFHLALPARHGPGTRRARTAQQNVQRPRSNGGERRKLLSLDLETEVLANERCRPCRRVGLGRRAGSASAGDEQALLAGSGDNLPVHHGFILDRVWDEDVDGFTADMFELDADRVCGNC